MSTMDEIEQDFIEAWNLEFSSKVEIQKDLRQHLEMMRKIRKSSDNLPTSSSSENDQNRYSSSGQTETGVRGKWLGSSVPGFD